MSQLIQNLSELFTQAAGSLPTSSLTSVFHKPQSSDAASHAHLLASLCVLKPPLRERPAKTPPLP